MKKFLGLITIALAVFLVGCSQKTYKVRFMDEDTLISEEEFSIQDKTINVPTPTKEGYTFDYWTFNDEKFDSFESITQDMTLQAVWKHNDYSVTFKDGDNVLKTVNVEHNGLVEEYVPTKEGYKFKYWTLNDEEYSYLTPVTGDIELIGVFEKEKYTIIFEDYNGTVLKQEELEYQDKIVAPSDPKRDETSDSIYTFNGWDCDFDVAKSNLTIIATYTQTFKCKVVFYNNDNTIYKEERIAPGAVLSGTYELADYETLKATYTFVGWKTTDGSSFALTNAITSDIYLYGDYTKEEKDINIDLTNKVVSFLGDSITSFYDASSSVNSYYHGTDEYYFPIYSATVKNVDQTWWYQVASMASLKIGINNSWSGSTCYNFGSEDSNGAMNLNRINTLGENGTPDIIIIHIGTNDNVNGFSAEVFKSSYQTMISRIQEKYKNTYIFCSTLGYSSYSGYSYTEARRVSYNNVIREIVAANDLFLIEIDKVQTESTYSTFLGDSLHPNAQGMKAYASCAVSSLYSGLCGLETYSLSYELNGGEMKDFEAFYNTKEDYTLPIPTKDGFAFEGWYKESDFSGSVITTTKGQKEDLKLYAAWGIKLNDDEALVTYILNGGHWLYETKEDLANDFLKDYGTYIEVEGLTIDTIGYKKDAAVFTDWSSNYARLPEFFKNNSQKWGWLLTLLNTNATNNKAQMSDSTTWPEPLAMEVWAFFKDSSPVSYAGAHTTADYSGELKDGWLANFMTEKQVCKKGSLPEVPYLANRTFDGWYTTSDFSGEKQTTITGNIVLYAKWI